MKLDAAAHATPITYLGKSGKQFVAVTLLGGQLIALASDNGAPDGCHLHFEQRAVEGGLDTAVWPRPRERDPPDAALVVERVTNGQGVMPSFKGTLDPQQIQAVAQYVSSVAGQ